MEPTMLAKILSKHKLTDTTVAKAVGVSKMSVGLWRRGLGYPNGRNLVALAAYLVQYEPALVYGDLMPALGTSERAVFKGIVPKDVLAKCSTEIK